MFRNNFQVSAVEARPSLITKMKEKDKANYPTNKIQITINVDDDNDNSPAFSPSKIHNLPNCSNQMLLNFSQAIIQNAKHITYHLISADNYVWNFPTTGIRKGAVIGNVLAKDPDQGLNSLIR